MILGDRRFLPGIASARLTRAVAFLWPGVYEPVPRSRIHWPAGGAARLRVLAVTSARRRERPCVCGCAPCGRTLTPPPAHGHRGGVAGPRGDRFPLARDLPLSPGRSARFRPRRRACGVRFLQGLAGARHRPPACPPPRFGTAAREREVLSHRGAGFVGSLRPVAEL